MPVTQICFCFCFLSNLSKRVKRKSQVVETSAKRLSFGLDIIFGALKDLKYIQEPSTVILSCSNATIIVNCGVPFSWFFSVRKRKIHGETVS